MAERKDTNTTYAVGWILMLFILTVIGYAIWAYNKYEIMNAVRWIRWAELEVVSIFVPNDYVVHTDVNGDETTFDELLYTVAQTPTARLSTDLISVISTITMRFYLVLFSGLFVLMSLWTMFYGPGTSFRRRYDVHGLISAQTRAFPYIAPFRDFDPSKQQFRPPGAPVPAELPPFAEALAPEEWIAYHSIPTYTDRNIDQAAAMRAFASQLGAPWRGWKYLKPYRQVLLAAFCLKAVRKRKESDEMLGDLAMCWNKGTLNLDPKLLRRARAVLRNEGIAG